MVESRIGGSTLKCTIDALGLLEAPEGGAARHLNCPKENASGALLEISKKHGVASCEIVCETAKGAPLSIKVDTVAVAMGTVGLLLDDINKFAGSAHTVALDGKSITAKKSSNNPIGDARE